MVCVIVAIPWGSADMMSLSRKLNGRWKDTARMAKSLNSPSNLIWTALLIVVCFGRAPHVISPWITEFKAATGGVVAMWILQV
jgi:hypothetical protein